jgi:hypothetical protein
MCFIELASCFDVPNRQYSRDDIGVLDKEAKPL